MGEGNSALKLAEEHGLIRVLTTEDCPSCHMPSFVLWELLPDKGEEIHVQGTCPICALEADANCVLSLEAQCRLSREGVLRNVAKRVLTQLYRETPEPNSWSYPQLCKVRERAVEVKRILNNK